MIIAVTEVLPKNADSQTCLPEISLQGYTTLWNSNFQTCNRGIAIYHKEDVKVVLDEELTAASNIEALWIRVAAPNNTELLIGVIYRSPSRATDNHRNLTHTISMAASHKPHYLLQLCKDSVG